MDDKQDRVNDLANGILILIGGLAVAWAVWLFTNIL